MQYSTTIKLSNHLCSANSLTILYICCLMWNNADILVHQLCRLWSVSIYCCFVLKWLLSWSTPCQPRINIAICWRSRAIKTLKFFVCWTLLQCACGQCPFQKKRIVVDVPRLTAMYLFTNFFVQFVCYLCNYFIFREQLYTHRVWQGLQTWWGFLQLISYLILQC